nr:MAG TPA: hypothetical protein [Caudoviricetes sp.]
MFLTSFETKKSCKIELLPPIPPPSNFANSCVRARRRSGLASF